MACLQLRHQHIWYMGELVVSMGCPRQNVLKYRVIGKSFRDFRPLRYSSRDGHAEEEYVNRKRDTPSFCPTLQVLDMLTSEGS